MAVLHLLDSAAEKVLEDMLYAHASLTAMLLALCCCRLRCLCRR